LVILPDPILQPGRGEGREDYGEENRGREEKRGGDGDK
jgi:hypothetical protein